MPTIRADTTFTVIDVFTVEPGDQDRLIEELGAHGDVLRGVAGFLSASYHRGLDGDRVANYAQWDSREAYESAMRLPEVQRALGRPPRHGKPDWHAYQCVRVVEPNPKRPDLEAPG